MSIYENLEFLKRILIVDNISIEILLLGVYTRVIHLYVDNNNK
jgi:hypothetical protein